MIPQKAGFFFDATHWRSGRDESKHFLCRHTNRKNERDYCHSDSPAFRLLCQDRIAPPPQLVDSGQAQTRRCKLFTYDCVRIWYVYSLFLRQIDFPTRLSEIALCAGGHTSEMMRFLFTLDFSIFGRVVFIVADTDKDSDQKARDFMAALPAGARPDHQIRKIPRTREVGQSYFSSIFSTIKSLMSSLFVMLRERPDLVR